MFMGIRRWYAILREIERLEFGDIGVAQKFYKSVPLTLKILFHCIQPLPWIDFYIRVRLCGP